MKLLRFFSIHESVYNAGAPLPEREERFGYEKNILSDDWDAVRFPRRVPRPRYADFTDQSEQC